jgi:hypothetical protein
MFFRNVLGLLSFTPGFSQESAWVNQFGNRLNGLPIRLAIATTWLKPGVQ